MTHHRRSGRPADRHQDQHRFRQWDPDRHAPKSPAPSLENFIGQQLREILHIGIGLLAGGHGQQVEHQAEVNWASCYICGADKTWEITGLCEECLLGAADSLRASRQGK